MNIFSLFGTIFRISCRLIPFSCLVLWLVFLPGGCKTVDTVNVGTAIGVAAGVLDQSQADALTKVARSFEDITPEQEYYIGRTVGAVVVHRYRPYNNLELNRYVNVLGQTLAQASDLPETFGGYHFLVLDTEEINAFAAPGGLIFITRGLLRCCKSEDALAAVLAHEIGHVQHKHGLRAIRQSRITDAATTLAATGARTYGGKDLAALTNTFEHAIGDIVTTMITNGYSRDLEQEADWAAVAILKRVGYDTNGLLDMLRLMKQRLVPGRPDFAKTHPSPDSRIAEIRPFIDDRSSVTTSAARQARFKRVLGDL